MVTDCFESDNDFVFIADNNENNTETTIYRFYVLTNFSNK